jgi:hypothetical protein
MILSGHDSVISGCGFAALCSLRLNCSVKNEKARDREVAGYEREPAVDG